jgi:hypothetical protein
MESMRRLTWLAALASATFLASTAPEAASAQNSVTIPHGVANAEGNSDNRIPFGGDPMRYQQVFMASEFGGARWITGFALRPDAATGAKFSETLSEVEIRISTTGRSTSSLSRDFADNVGTDEALVFSGQLTLASSLDGPADGPKDFDAVVRFSRPFWYDPKAGNLLLEVRNSYGGRTTQFDAHDAPDTVARIWNYGADATTAKADDPYPSVGLVVRFDCQ